MTIFRDGAATGTIMNIKGNKVIIRPKKPADAENDYRWQTDPELSALDAMAPSTMSYRSSIGNISTG